ncbi:cytochrome P450 [Krasilnikovia sp. MM14-A1259]|uniref:cytochrome P450 n=1 Tax=Krasilnikovia sp. MM14-A1259 TaxID=3373539 RepID=UPI00380F0A8A
MTDTQTVASRCPINHGRIDLVDPRLYSEGDPHPIWQAMRVHRPVSWHPVGDDLGFWSVTKHRDAEEVLRDSSRFTSERGTIVSMLGTDDPAGGNQIAATDPPRHTAMREPLQRALSMAAVERQREAFRSQIRTLIEPLGDGGVFDFGTAMLAMPMAITGVLMDLPERDWPELTRLTMICIAPDDPEYEHPRGAKYNLDAAHRELFGYFQDVVRERENRLGNDLISVLLRTEFEGRRMTRAEAVSNCYSVLLGANVTTPHSPNFALAELIGTPGLDALATDPGLTKSGVEEALRWASPVNHLLRYATRNTVLNGVSIAAGEAVVVWVGSANRDEEVFTEPEVFDLRRVPNKHLAFGVGPHYCVGHTVARVTLRVLFEELFTQFTDFAACGKVERLRSTFVAGIKHQPITARRRGER